MYPDEPVADGGLDEIHDLLVSIDHAVPPLSAAAVAALAEARTRAGAARRRTALRWAAAVLLTVGVAGAAVAAPGSPVLRWVRALVAPLTGRGDRPAATPGTREGKHARETAGIAVLPGDRFTVQFAADTVGGVALVSFGEREEILVQARPGAARFTTEPDGLRIEARSAADTFAIEIPRTAARVEIRAAGARLLVAERGRIVPALVSDSLGRYRLSLPSARH